MDHLNINPVFELEFSPSPSKADHLIRGNHSVRHNLLLKFSQDDLDQTVVLNSVLQKRFPDQYFSFKTFHSVGYALGSLGSRELGNF